MTSIPATSLWELEQDRDPDMQARFERFHSANPEVYRLFDQFTRNLFVADYSAK